MNDFYDEEYKKHQQQQAQNDPNGQNGAQPQGSPVFNGWYNTPAPEPKKKNGKTLYIVLLVVALVACIGLGYLLCTIVQAVTHRVSDDADGIYSEVVQYLKDNYYADVSDEQWTAAIEASGTALMRNAGDRFCRLMSPQTYYDFTHPVVEIVGNERTFGFSEIWESGLGLYISNVITDSPAYGKLFVGDIVLELTEMKASNGSAPVVGKETFSQFAPGEWTEDSVRMVMNATDSANFRVLRRTDDGYDIVSVPLKRGVLFQPNSKYNYQFVEFYFGQNKTNVSTRINKSPSSATSTEELRNLDALPADTGYVRILEFMDYIGSDKKTVSASDEFKKVMKLFKESGLKHLVLDLKGNPGGNVSYVSEIASMLITDGKLTSAQKKSVTNTDGKLLITYFDMPKPSPVRQNEYRTSSYFSYFGALSDKCDIVVWTDGSSASASELLTGCMLDYGTAVQMGTTTYGKGIAQTWNELPYTGTVTDINGKQIDYPWAVYYTCASYYSPLGVNIHDKGYTPDDAYNGLSSYADLMQKVNEYWG